MLFHQPPARSQHNAPRWIAPVLGGLLMMPVLPTVLDSAPQTTQQLRPSVEEPVSNTTRTAAAWTIAALGVGIVAFSWKASQASEVAAMARSSRTTKHINRSHQRKLLSLLHNDYRAAERLIQQTQAKHPDRSIDWCIEKVIYDLQRDRH
jgi:uncharacterized protein HemX